MAAACFGFSLSMLYWGVVKFIYVGKPCNAICVEVKTVTEISVVLLHQQFVLVSWLDMLLKLL